MFDKVSIAEKSLRNVYAVHEGDYYMGNNNVNIRNLRKGTECFPNLIFFTGGQSLKIHEFELELKSEDIDFKIISVSIEILRPNENPLTLTSLSRKESEDRIFIHKESLLKLTNEEIFRFTLKDGNYQLLTKTVQNMMSSRVRSLLIKIETPIKKYEYIVSALFLPLQSFNGTKPLSIFRTDSNKKKELVNFLVSMNEGYSFPRNWKSIPIEPNIKLSIPYIPPFILTKISPNTSSHAITVGQNKRKLDACSLNEFESEPKQRKPDLPIVFETLEPRINSGI